MAYRLNASIAITAGSCSMRLAAPHARRVHDQSQGS
jgi:hypothetical protein